MLTWMRALYMDMRLALQLDLLELAGMLLTIYIYMRMELALYCHLDFELMNQRVLTLPMLSRFLALEMVYHSINDDQNDEKQILFLQ